MSERIEFISVREFRRVMRYIRRNYPPLKSYGVSSKMMLTMRIFSNEDGLVTRSDVQLYDGDSFKRVIIHLSVKEEGASENICGSINIRKDIYSLDEFIEIESKAKQLHQFTKSLNIWKH